MSPLKKHGHICSSKCNCQKQWVSLTERVLWGFFFRASPDVDARKKNPKQHPTKKQTNKTPKIKYRNIWNRINKSGGHFSSYKLFWRWVMVSLKQAVVSYVLSVHILFSALSLKDFRWLLEKIQENISNAPLIRGDVVAFVVAAFHCCLYQK